MTFETLDELLADGRAALAAIVREPRFDFEISFTDDYDDLLAGDAGDAASDADSVIDAAREYGRLVLAAEAGAGKTTVTARVLSRAIERRLAAVRVDLRRWSP